MSSVIAPLGAHPGGLARLPEADHRTREVGGGRAAWRDKRFSVPPFHSDAFCGEGASYDRHAWQESAVMVWQVRPDSNAQNTPELHATEEDPQFNEMRGGKILGAFSLAVIGDFHEGRELLHPEWVPEIFYLREVPKKFSPIISIRGLFAVQREVIELIEEFEPRVHQFVPIRIARTGTKQALPVRYSLVNIGQMLHSVVLDEKVLRSSI